MEKVAEADLPTKFGKFRIHAFVDGDKEHIALVSCDHKPENGLPVRVHSKCFTGDTMCSLRCDCRAQLEASLKYIHSKDGILIYLDQEGRGIGLANKIKAYALQDQGMDTIEANEKLGFKSDLRNFQPAAEILKYFGIKKISILTNNPDKIKDMERHGIEIVKIIPLVVGKNSQNKDYLKTKKEKMNHMI